MPRQVKNGLDICPAYIGIRTHRIHLGELVYLFADLGIRLFIKSELSELILPDPGFIIDVLVFTEFLLDDLKLLPEIVLTLPSVHVLDYSVVDPPCNGKNIVFPAYDVDKVSYPHLDRINIQKSLFDIIVHIDLIGDQAAHQSRISDTLDQ